MRYIYLHIPGADRHNLIYATSVAELKTAAGSGHWYEAADVTRLLVGRSVTFVADGGGDFLYEPTHVVCYDQGTGNEVKSPALYVVEKAEQIGSGSATTWRCTATLSGIGTALLRGGSWDIELDRASLSDTYPSTTPEPAIVQRTTETTISGCTIRTNTTGSSGTPCGNLVPVITVTRDPAVLDAQNHWTKYMPTIGDDPVMPIPVSYALWTEDGNDSIPYAGEYGYRSLISWLNTVGSNVDYVSRVQFLPSEIVTSATIGSKGVILGGGDALFSISPSTTITLTSHQPVPSGVDNKKAYYAGIYNVYNKGSKIASFDSSYALQSDTQFSIVLTSGYGGVAARLKVVQAGTTDMYIPLTVPDAAVILDAYTTKEQDAARNVWSSVIAGALTGVMHGGVYGMAAGAAGGALAGSASAFAECMRASRQNVTIGQTPENYVYDSTPWLMVTWEHPDGQTQLRQYFRRHGYACTWRGSSFPGQRTYYNAYQGRARWWEDRDSTSLLSGVSREDINTAINDELGAGVVIWTLAQAANVGNTITVGNP